MTSSINKLIVYCHKYFIRTPKNAIGASVARIIMGIWLLFYYLQSFPVRFFIWGDAGPISYDLFIEKVTLTRSYSLLSYSSDRIWFDGLYFLAILSSVTLMIGLFSRASAVVGAVLLWSFHARNEFILDGGDNIGRIFLMFFIFIKCSDFLSVDARLQKNSQGNSMQNILHNLAFYGIAVQLCILYLTSGLSKVTGPLWQNGTAIYYVLKSNNYSRSDVGLVLTRNYFFVTFTSYFIILLQCSFAFLLWSKTWRVPIILSLIAMHIGIAFLMGLIHFSTVMIATQCLLLPDKFYIAAGGFMKKIRLIPRLPMRKEKAILLHPKSD